MTIIWIVIALLGIGITILGFSDDILPLIIGGIIVFIAAVCCFFFVPVSGYMEVESIHWNWTIDVFTFKEVSKSGRTGRKYSRYQAEEEAKRNIPANANAGTINIETHSGSRTVTDEEWKDSDGRTHKRTHTEYYYYADYLYTVNEWVKTKELSAIGSDKSPYEPERIYDTTAPDELGNHKCGAGHNEYYTVTGIVDEESKTYNISKQDWEKMRESDEFSYKKFRFGKEIWDLQIAQ